tara:strand:+ start:392 stop:2206 length:1815 start_codon:yes stop_codon:yes gene_type:complete
MAKDKGKSKAAEPEELSVDEAANIVQKLSKPDRKNEEFELLKQASATLLNEVKPGFEFEEEEDDGGGGGSGAAEKLKEAPGFLEQIGTTVQALGPAGMIALGSAAYFQIDTVVEETRTVATVAEEKWEEVKFEHPNINWDDPLAGFTTIIGMGDIEIDLEPPTPVEPKPKDLNESTTIPEETESGGEEEQTQGETEENTTTDDEPAEDTEEVEEEKEEPKKKKKKGLFGLFGDDEDEDEEEAEEDEETEESVEEADEAEESTEEESEEPVEEEAEEPVEEEKEEQPKKKKGFFGLFGSEDDEGEEEPTEEDESAEPEAEATEEPTEDSEPEPEAEEQVEEKPKKKSGLFSFFTGGDDDETEEQGEDTTNDEPSQTETTEETQSEPSTETDDGDTEIEVADESDADVEQPSEKKSSGGGLFAALFGNNDNTEEVEENEVSTDEPTIEVADSGNEDAPPPVSEDEPEIEIDTLDEIKPHSMVTDDAFVENDALPEIDDVEIEVTEIDSGETFEINLAEMSDIEVLDFVEAMDSGEIEIDGLELADNFEEVIQIDDVIEETVEEVVIEQVTTPNNGTVVSPVDIDFTNIFGPAAPGYDNGESDATPI